MKKQGTPASCKDPGLALGEKFEYVNGRKVYETRYKWKLSTGVFYIFCKHCNCIKPPRTHHCRILGKCVYNMDHYCPWMCNCIGYFNYRFFVLFLLYMFLGCFYCVLLTARAFLEINLLDRWE